MKINLRNFSLFFLALFFSVVAGAAVYATDYPDYDGYVNDFAGVLSDPFEASLEEQLAQYEQETSNQIVVVTVKTVVPEDINGYGIRLAEKWKIGQADKDNGLIMLFAMDDREMRIEVGSGLEGDLTDLKSKQIIDNIITPEFRNGNYESGIDKGLQEVKKVIADPNAAVSQEAGGLESNSDTSGWVYWIIGIFILLVLIILFAVADSTGGSDDDGDIGFFGGGSSSGSSSGGGGGFSGGGARGGW